MNRILTFFCMLFFTIVIYGQTKTTQKHSIDAELEKCLSIDSNWTTYGMTQCQVRANEKWDKELNKYYKLLMNELNEDEKAKLKAAQIEWLKFRDIESDFAKTLYDNMQGTMWIIVKAGRYTEIVRQRALELKLYYETLHIAD